MIFENREQAGELLSEKLKNYKDNKNAMIIGLARGGIVTAAAIAKNLNLPLDIMAPRKIGAPLNPELAIGAITQDGQAVLDKNLIDSMGITQSYIDKKIEKEKLEAQRRLKIYRAGKESLNLENKIVILVDDGIATGSTIKAATKSAKSQNAKNIIIAVPVAAKDIVEELKKEVDKVICIETPINFLAISMYYKYFGQTTDEEVKNIMGS
ncbi:phosphoribosyltransferase [Candidatus Babeliales bacterium]|nr:phosphoribosyltransferase [Candidatus Babeliales bacterium]